MSRLLIMSSNPRQDLKLDREISDLTNLIQRLKGFELYLGLGVIAQELPGLLADRHPTFVHFCGHGAGAQGLVFQDETGKEQLMSTEVLTRIFRIFKDEVNCVVLNACDSDFQAEAIVEDINYMVGMSQPILDRAAHLFSVGFYRGLATGKSIEQSYEMGCIAIQIWSETNSSQVQKLRKLEYVGSMTRLPQIQLAEYLKPVLHKKSLLFPSSQAAKGLVEAVPTGSAPFNSQPEFAEYVRQEIDRKDYKDRTRDAYDNFGQLSAQNVVSLPLGKSEYEQRKVFLAKVKQFWIEGFLQPSLQAGATISLSRKDRQNAFANRSQGIEALSVELDASYEQIHTTQIYGEIGQGRTLLILGSPGAGKSIALLQLAQHLIERSEQNLSIPMPVVFNLSSWAKDRKSIVDWSIDELREKYQVPKSLSEDWIVRQQLILLLDGLDEVQADRQNECVRAVNEFIGLFPQTEVAICSRVKDYEALTDRLQISSALCLQPLSSEQVHQFLDSVGGSWGDMKTLLQRNWEVEQFAQSPLILHLMSVAYQGWSIEKLIPELCPTTDRHKRLFDTYIDRRLARGATSEYSPKQVLHWLSWLAGQMVQEKQTIFLIEKMQPTWLKTNAQKRLYQFRSFLIGAVLVVLILWPIYAWDPLFEIGSKGQLGQPRGGLLDALKWGLVLGLVCGWGKAEIKTVETLTLPWNKTWKDLLGGLFSGLKFGVIFSLALGLIYGLWYGARLQEDPIYGFKWGIIYGLRWGLSSGITLVLINAFKGSEIEKKNIPNQGIWKSAIAAGIFGLISWLIFVPIYLLNSDLIRDIDNWKIIIYLIHLGDITISDINQLVDVITPGLRWGLMLGLIFGGGLACIRHFALRQILYQKGCIPWNYAKFLNFASDRLLMKKVGGGYIFFHRMLLEHFAQTKLDGG